MQLQDKEDNVLTPITHTLLVILFLILGHHRKPVGVTILPARAIAGGEVVGLQWPLCY